ALPAPYLKQKGGRRMECAGAFGRLRSLIGFQSTRERFANTGVRIPQSIAIDGIRSIGSRGGRMLRFIFTLLLCAFATRAAAQYPAGPVRLVVPQAAGSPTDPAARILGAELAKEIGQQIVIDNRPGGALPLGLDLTAKAEPDGYTICMGPIGGLAITRHMV